MRRAPSSRTPALEVDRQLDNTAYDNVVIVKNSIAAVNTVAANITSVDSVATAIVPNIAEILLADENAAIATAMAATCTSAYDQFAGRYLGAKVTAPTTDNEGNPLLVGCLYFDTSAETMRVYGDLGWYNVGTSSKSQLLGNADSKAIQYMAQGIAETITVPEGTNAYSVDSLMIGPLGSLIIPNNSAYKII